MPMPLGDGQGDSRSCRVALLLIFIACLLGPNAVAASAATVQTGNTAPITINDSASPPTAASSYPSSFTTSGIAGVISHLQVRLVNLSHGYPDDIDILLVGPTG